jgi:hypothetical protein
MMEYLPAILSWAGFFAFVVVILWRVVAKRETPREIAASPATGYPTGFLAEPMRSATDIERERIEGAVREVQRWLDGISLSLTQDGYDWILSQSGAVCPRCDGVPLSVTEIRALIFCGDTQRGVDEAAYAWCMRCETKPPDVATIELPWLDGLPITLLPRLYDRPAFHRLGVEVRRYEQQRVP